MTGLNLGLNLARILEQLLKRARAYPAKVNGPEDTQISIKESSDTDANGGLKTGPKSTLQLLEVENNKPKQRIGFAIDIDGVLLSVKEPGKPLNRAGKTINRILAADIPFVIFTNRGRRNSEESQASSLSRLLHTDIATDQMVLSFSPLRGYLPELADKHVLLIGDEDDWTVTTALGFNNLWDQRHTFALPN